MNILTGAQQREQAAAAAPREHFRIRREQLVGVPVCVCAILTLSYTLTHTHILTAVCALKVCQRVLERFSKGER